MGMCDENPAGENRNFKKWLSAWRISSCSAFLLLFLFNASDAKNSNTAGKVGKSYFLSSMKQLSYNVLPMEMYHENPAKNENKIGTEYLREGIAVVRNSAFALLFMFVSDAKNSNTTGKVRKSYFLSTSCAQIDLFFHFLGQNVSIIARSCAKKFICRSDRSSLLAPYAPMLTIARLRVLNFASYAIKLFFRQSKWLISLGAKIFLHI